MSGLVAANPETQQKAKKTKDKRGCTTFEMRRPEEEMKKTETGEDF